jgi:haloalkane dehalogenase
MTDAADQTITNPRPAWLDEHAWPFPIQALNHAGATIAYTDTGTGPVLVFVHVGLWSIVWRDAITCLCDRFRCITLDVPGTGLSPEPAAGRPDFTAAAGALDAVVRTLDLRDLTLVLHDLGAIPALQASTSWPERVRGLVAVNTFAWRPAGPLFRGMLGVMGNPVTREIDGITKFLPLASSTRWGVGRNWDHATRTAFRHGMGPRQRRNFHRYMAAVRHHDYHGVDTALTALADQPILTIFGEHNDPLRFQPQWKDRFPEAVQIVVPNGLHLPMCDNPALVAASIARQLQTDAQAR